MSTGSEKKYKYENDWFRKTTWTKEDEEDFFAHFGRARNYNRPQYLRIQTVTLLGKDRYEAAKKLIDKYFLDYPDDRFERALMYKSLSEVSTGLKDHDKAFEYLKKAAEFELEFPNVTCDARLDYAVLIVKQRKKDLFEEAEKHVDLGGMIFPYQLYRAYAVLAIISKAKGDLEKYRYCRECAESAASAKKSWIWHAKGTEDPGLAKRDKKLDKLMR